MIARDPRRVFQLTNLMSGAALGCGLAHAVPLAPAASVAVAMQTAMAAACLCPRCRWVGANITRSPVQSAVSLTFDDGPDPQLTPWILSVLRAYDARASFFCVGEKARQHPHLIEAIAADGHSVENHSDRHRYGFAALHRAAIAREVMQAQRTITGLTGVAPRFFRAPFGFRNPWLAPVLDRHALRYVSWSRRGFDTVDTHPKRILKRLLSGLTGGEILLLHDGSSARGTAGKPVLYNVLPELLATIRQRQLAAVDLPTLLGD